MVKKKNTNILLTTARREDVPNIYSMCKKNWQNFVEIDEYYAKCIDDPRCSFNRYYIYKNGENIMGASFFRDADISNFCLNNQHKINAVISGGTSVLKEYRMLGLGTKIFLHGFKQLESEGYDIVYGFTNISLYKKFYSKMGWRFNITAKNYMFRKDKSTSIGSKLYYIVSSALNIIKLKPNIFDLLKFLGKKKNLKIEKLNELDNEKIEKLNELYYLYCTGTKYAFSKRDNSVWKHILTYNELFVVSEPENDKLEGYFLISKINKTELVIEEIFIKNNIYKEIIDFIEKMAKIENKKIIVIHTSEPYKKLLFLLLKGYSLTYSSGVIIKALKNFFCKLNMDENKGTLIVKDSFTDTQTVIGDNNASVKIFCNDCDLLDFLIGNISLKEMLFKSKIVDVSNSFDKCAFFNAIKTKNKLNDIFFADLEKC